MSHLIQNVSQVELGRTGRIRSSQNMSEQISFFRNRYEYLMHFDQ